VKTSHLDIQEVLAREGVIARTLGFRREMVAEVRFRGNSPAAGRFASFAARTQTLAC
jgi:hypothetical protein